MEKKTYSRPVLEFEQFLPNHYIANCFTYTANLICDLGKSKVDNVLPFGWEGYYEVHGPQYNFEYDGKYYKGTGAEHGAPCATTTVTVTVRNGVVTKSGKEGNPKESIVLDSINIPNIEQVSSIGQKFSNCYWESAGRVYKHRGNGEVTYFNKNGNAS